MSCQEMVPDRLLSITITIKIMNCATDPEARGKSYEFLHKLLRMED